MQIDYRVVRQIIWHRGQAIPLWEQARAAGDSQVALQDEAVEPHRDAVAFRRARGFYVEQLIAALAAARVWRSAHSDRRYYRAGRSSSMVLRWLEGGDLKRGGIARDPAQLAGRGAASGAGGGAELHGQ